ncbi:ATP-binding protein [Streptomyces sp. NPDC001889]
MSAALKTAVLYACGSDATATVAALDSLARTAAERGYTVRAAASDVAGPRVVLGDRRGWSSIAPFLKGGGSALFVRSREELGADEARRAPVLAWLEEQRVTVTAAEPAAWETDDWCRIWERSDVAGALGGVGDPSVGMCCAVFPALAVHAPLARRLARKFLRSWEPVLAGQGVDLDLLLLAVDELVTNALTHGSAPGDLIALTLECDRRVLCVGVEDRSPDPPCLRRPGDADTGGRGLPLVQRIAPDWGYARHHNRPGKRVWVRVPLQALPRARALAATP